MDIENVHSLFYLSLILTRGHIGQKQSLPESFAMLLLSPLSSTSLTE